MSYQSTRPWTLSPPASVASREGSIPDYERGLAERDKARPGGSGQNIYDDGTVWQVLPAR